MIPKPPRPVWLAIVGASFVPNAAYPADHARAATFGGVFARMELAERSDDQAGMAARDRKLGGPPGAVGGHFAATEALAPAISDLGPSPDPR